MKKSTYARLNVLIILVLALINTSNLQAQVKADAIVGVWETEDKDAEMEVFKSGNEYQAKLLWGIDIVNTDDTSKKDVNNPDKNLQSRDLVGTIYIKSLKFDDDEWGKGRVYNNSNGKWYKCYAWLENKQLHLRGYLGMKILGQTTKWNRIK